MRHPLAIAKQKYNSHKHSSKYREIEFNITFDEWYNWWLSNGVDKNQIQPIKTASTLCMCRFNDIGSYQLDNIYADTISNNSITANQGRKHSDDTKKLMSEQTLGRTAWNKGKKGLQIAWNKGLTGQVSPMLNKKHSEETKEKIRQSIILKRSIDKGDLQCN
jgi:hypothetical protein